MSFSLERRKALRNLVPFLYRGVANESDAGELIALYARAFSAHGIGVGQQAFFHPWSIAADIPSDWIDANQRLQDQDPCVEFLSRSPDGTPFIVSQVLDGPARRTELFRAFTRAGLIDSMVQRFRAPWAGDVFMVFLRPKGAKPLSDDDALLARLLHPLTGGALATRSALHALGLPHADAPAGHAYVSFPRMRVSLSAEGERTWAKSIGRAVTGPARARVERLVARAAIDFLAGAPGSRSRLVLPSLRLELAWVPAKRGETHRALALFFHEAKGASKLAAPAAELLSPKQRAVAELAARGARNVEIAATLAISAETVRTHLREAMRRLQVDRRAELAAFLRRPEPREE